MVKKGLGDSYENTIIPAKIRAYLDLTKPASSVGVMSAAIFSSIIYGELYHTSGVAFVLDNWTTVIFASVTLFLLHGGSQAMNMAEDAFIDKETPHKQNRPIPGGVVSEEEARSLAWIFILWGVLRAQTITPEFGIYVVLLAFFGVFYNLEPIRAKKHLWINLIWQSTSRGLLLYPATFAVWGDIWNPISWSMGVIAFLLVLAFQNTADYSDVEVDEEFNIITPAVYHNLDNLTKIMTGLTIIMFVVITVFIQFDVIPNFWSLYILSIPLVWSLIYLWRNPNNISDISGNSFTWYVYYLSLAGLYILPAFQLVLLG